MKKKDKETFEETKLGDDLDFFDELEDAGGPPAPAPSATKPVPKPASKPAPRPEPAKPPRPPAGEEEGILAEGFVDLAPDVPVRVAAVIGRADTNVGELIKYRIGHVVELGRPPGETVDLMAGGRVIARAELVEVDGKLGARVIKMVK